LSAGSAAVAAVAGLALVAGARAARADGAPSRLSRSRWLLAPALVYLVAGPISSVGPGVVPTWTLWALALLILALVLVTTIRTLAGTTALPPVWFVFAIAWCTAVAGWSVRDLNVEYF